MALSIQFIEEHIATWQDAFKGHPYRARWPSRLFHHSPLENAISILTTRSIRSRLDPANPKARDVAGHGVIDARDAAHQSARLYFRPRTPTQYHIEGIRKPEDCKFEAHAPILVMFVLDARKVLMRSDVNFSDRNMQSSSAVVGNTEAFFASIPFAKVYHEGLLGGDTSIIQHRCAEVLTPSPLPLDDVLQWVYCRSEAERQTLLFYLGPAARDWKSKILISEDLKVFQREFVFVEEVALNKRGLRFKLNPRLDRANVTLRIDIWTKKGTHVLTYSNDMPAVPELPKTSWIHRCELDEGLYRVVIRLEGHLAFEGILSMEPSLV